MIRTRTFLHGAAAGLAILPLAAFAAEPVKIGEINSYSRFPGFTLSYQKGWQLAVEEVNAAGGVLGGRPLDVLSRDDGGDPSKAVTLANELLAGEGVALLAGTFLSNAGVTQIFNVADVDTATWVSQSLGVMTDSYATTSTGESSSATQPFPTHSTSTSLHLVQRALMTPDEVLRLSRRRLLLMRPGQDPLFPWKLRHYADGEFRGLFDA